MRQLCSSQLVPENWSEGESKQEESRFTAENAESAKEEGG
jgi:hypothetical protein